jgi:hypothetical protein
MSRGKAKLLKGETMPFTAEGGHMARKMVVWISGMVILAALATPSFGQLEHSVMEGIVTDPQGAFIPGVKVIVTATETNATLPTVTNSTGYYRVTSLVPGKYQVHFEASGFSPLDIKDIVVPAGQTIRTDAQLHLGATRQTIEVSSAAAILQTAATDFSATLGATAIQQIPLAGRDLQQLVLLVPGVVGNGPPGSSFGFNSEFGTFPDPTHMQGTDVSVNGGQTGTNAWYLDGNFNLSGVAESVVVNPSPDAVGEFQMITSGFSSEYGRSGGAVFSVALKSGTNQLHGDVYEYVRNSYFNARNPFTSINSTGQIIPQNALRFNNFGGTLGGPVVIPHLYNGRNKTFFFFSWDESILHLNGSTVLSVPTALERSGDFSEDPNSARYGIWNPYSSIGPASDGTFARSAFGTPVAGSPIGCTGVIGGSAGNSTAVNPTSADCNFATQIPQNMLSKTAAFFMNTFPMPNYLNPLSACPMASGGETRICSNYLAGLGSSQDGANISLKIDHQWSEKNRYFGEWLFNPGKYNNYRLPWTGATFPSSSVGYGSNLPFDFANQIIALGNTYTFSPTLINEFRASFTRQYYTTHPEEAGYPNSVTDLSAVENVLAPIGVPVYPPTPDPTFFVALPGGGAASWGSVNWVSNYTATESYTILDNLTKVLGKHTLRTGFIYRLSHAAEFQSSVTNLGFGGAGTVNPITGLGGGSGLAQFMLGALMNNGSDAYGERAWEPYMSWSYRGLYLQDDYRITPKFTLNLGLRYDIFGSYKTRQHPDSKYCPDCPNSYTGLPGLIQYEGGPGFPMNSAHLPSNLNDIGPRVNFAWTPFSDHNTVIRGGYDIFYSNAYAAVNSPQSVENAVAWAPYYYWYESSNPTQCATFSNGCVAWSLDTPGDKGPLATPPYSTTFPAQERSPDYKDEIIYTNKPARDPMVQTWTLEIQRELPGNFALTVGYVGSRGTHLVGDMWFNADYVHTADKIEYKSSINTPVPITNFYSGQTAQALAQVWGTDSLPPSILLTPNPFYYLFNTSQFNGNSIYHALQVQLNKRFSHGLNLNVAYTNSKSIVSADTGSMVADAIDPIHFARNGDVGGRTGASFGSAIGTAFQDPDNVKADRALAFNDIPQILNVSATYQLPFGAGRSILNRKGALNQLVGGWILTPNFHAEGGVALSISGPCDGITCRPDLVGNPKAVPGGQNENDWINAAAFLPPYGADQTFWANPNPTDPRYWQFGTAGTRLPGLRSPGFWNVDTSLAKQFHLSESKYFEFRWEMFNALNHQNLGMPNTGYCLPPNPDGSTDAVHQAGCQFGRITNIQTDPRAMEFALKFFW